MASPTPHQSLQNFEQSLDDIGIEFLKIHSFHSPDVKEATSLYALIFSFKLFRTDWYYKWIETIKMI